MNSKTLYKKFSVGLPLHLSKRELIKFLDEYGFYIKEIYFSPPYAVKYHTRAISNQQFLVNSFSSKEFFSILSIIKTYNIELSLALNTHGLRFKDVFLGIIKVLSKIKVDNITTFPKYAYLLNIFVPSISLTLTYNWGFDSFQKLKKIPSYFNCVVIGNKLLRDFELFNDVKKKGFKIKLLINNGCTHGCHFCIDGTCSQYFKIALEKNNNNYNSIYASQSIMPYELHEHYLKSGLIDYYKISCRSSDIFYLAKCLKSYIYNDNNVTTYNDYYLWCRLAHLNNDIAYKKYDLQEIVHFKNNLWKETRNYIYQ